MKKTVLLAILDGYGFSKNKKGNAVLNSNTPNLDKLISENPNTLIEASGLAVGLPEGQIGNSEVGHTNLGAGRVVYQGLTRISKAIEDQEFFQNREFLNVINYCKQNNKKLHIMGLASNGGVHSHLSHLFALLKLAKLNGLKKVYIHCFTDGRDVDIHSAKDDIQTILSKTKELLIGRVASVMGRYFAMDRDNRWERIEIAYRALTKGIGEESDDIINTINSRYQSGETDEFLKPIICDKNGLIEDKDAIIFFNFRPDRARQITKAFVDPDFNQFERAFLNPSFVSMTQYDESIKNVSVAFKPISINNGLAEYISNLGLTQFHIAETEKYAHVTFFFNGGVEKQFPGEKRSLIPSPNVATYDLKPEMSADQVAIETLKAIDSQKYDLIILNFANCDMVGHTGSYQAAVKAVEAVDKNIGKIAEKIKEKNGLLIITADHGNAEEMIKDDGQPMTAHTTNPVVFVVVGAHFSITLKNNGKLANVAPTILDLMGLPKPKEMTEDSLILK